MKQSIQTIENKLKKLEEDLLEAKTLLAQTKKAMIQDGTFYVFSYFSFSFRLPQNSEDPNLYIIGSFIIKNKGEQSLHRPYICLKMSQTKDISFSGKINSENLVDSDFSPIPMQTWYYIDQESEALAQKNGEYWLEPINVKVLPADRSLNFANFMIRLDRTKIRSPFKLEGAVFGNELEEGLKALNKIQVNIT